jgi:DNA-binding transcriptional LysR family regulator
MPRPVRSSAATISEWDDLRVVLALSEHGTISAAAPHLHLSHPTLSRRLRALEERLGTRIFERTPSGLRLTAEGREMLELAQRMRADIALLERRIGGRDAQTDRPVRLTAPDAVAEYLLPGLLAEVCAEHSDLTIDLVVSNQVLSLAERAAEVALRITKRPAPALRGRRVGTIAMAIYAHRDARSTAWVGFDAALACSGPGTWVARNVPDDHIRLRANTLLGAVQAVRSGVGSGVLPCFVGESLPELARVGAPIESLSLPLWLLVHEDLARIPRIRRVCDALAAKLKSHRYINRER